MSHRLNVVNLLQACLSKKVEVISIPSIHRLPPEILVQIFFLSEKQTRKSRYPHLRLSWVCRYWRQIINGFDGFWRVIQFYPWKGKKFIQELVSRSGSARLSVLSPLERDMRIWKIFGRNDIVPVFNDLLTTESNRIGLLYMEEDPSGRLSKVLTGKTLPAMHTFICQFEPSSQALSIIGSAPNLQNLQITLSSISSLTLLKPSFERLRRLDIRLPHSGPCTREFFHCLSCCINLELLTISTITDLYPRSGEFYIQAGTILPKLTSLEVTDYMLIEQLRAPALRSLRMTTETKEVGFPTQNYLIFDDYDLSSLTYLFIRGIHTNIYESSAVYVSGFVDTVTRSETWGLDNRNLDLRGNLPPSPLVPIQFEICAPTYYTSLSSNSSFFSKVLPKLHNIERLLISPFNWSILNPPPEVFTSDLLGLRVFLKEILGNLSSASLQSIMFTGLQFEPDLLRVLFEIINSYSSSLAWNLDLIGLSFSTPRNGEIKISDSFGEELVRSLRLLQETGQKPLRTSIMFYGASNCDLSEKKWFTEAAALGIQMVESCGI